MASEKENAGIRQAAILIASLDSQTARQLLQQMPPATAKSVRKAMVDLGRISAEEQQAVLAAFKARVQSPKGKSSTLGGSTSGPSTTGPLGNSPFVNGIPNQRPDAGSATNISFVSTGGSFSGSLPTSAEFSSANYWSQYTADQIIEAVTSERPTVIAVVLTQLQPLIANHVLGRLNMEQRKEVLVQLSRLQHIDAEIIQEIQEQLQRKLALIPPLPYADPNLGLTRLKSILEAGDEIAKIELCKAIQESGEINGSLRFWIKEQLGVPNDSNDGSTAVKTRAEEALPSSADSSSPTVTQRSPIQEESRSIRSDSLTKRNRSHVNSSQDEQHVLDTGSAFDTAHSYVDFEDLKWIGLNQLATVLQTCEPRALLVALSTADEELLNRVALLFSKKDWKRLNERLRSLGAVDDEDRLAARMIVAETAQRLLIGEDLDTISNNIGERSVRAA